MRSEMFRCTCMTGKSILRAGVPISILMRAQEVLVVPLSIQSTPMKRMSLVSLGTLTIAYV